MSEIQITVSATWNALPLEMRGNRAFVLHDFQSADTNYLPRVDRNNAGKPAVEWIGLPETEKMGDSVFEAMNEEWQWFWFDWLNFYAPDGMSLSLLKQRWGDLTAGNKAFCNKHGGKSNPGSDKEFFDYINGTGNTDAPMAQENLTTCGNVVILTGGKRNIGGKTFLGVWCLDRLLRPPDNLVEHPALDCFIHAATTCRSERSAEENFPRHSIAPNGTRIVNNFPHTDGGRVPVPFVCSRGLQGEFMGIKVRENWIQQIRLAPLDDDEFPSPIVR